MNASFAGEPSAPVLAEGTCAHRHGSPFSVSYDRGLPLSSGKGLQRVLFRQWDWRMAVPAHYSDSKLLDTPNVGNASPYHRCPSCTRYMMKHLYPTGGDGMCEDCVDGLRRLRLVAVSLQRSEDFNLMLIHAPVYVRKMLTAFREGTGFRTAPGAIMRDSAFPLDIYLLGFESILEVLAPDTWSGRGAVPEAAGGEE